ncbi:antA/AntB antirepressor family protein [Aggregatibacter actinomycetemcomitans]|uniref:antA/AntB antirepressor family protein n=1 Tax=Aggregatibacter actinomycetemcomitans TaxID=714 RepID=UPI0021CC1207|nr:antA/AntB antirepressor family protein [Aggregatibacter actinomycetemcomitans]
MANLIQISNSKINNSEVKTVNARELHSFLEVSTRFSDWIQRRISEYEFVENQDFVVLLKNEKNPVGGGDHQEKSIYPLIWQKNYQWLSATKKENKPDNILLRWKKWRNLLILWCY